MTFIFTKFNDFVYRFSRKIIWLKLSTSNHNPKIIARYYLEAVEEAGGSYHYCILWIGYCCKCCIGCPKVVRGDYGTENASVAKIHLAFRMNNTSDVTKDFLYGPSTANTVSCSHYWQKNQTSHPSCSLNPRPFVILFTPSLEAVEGLVCGNQNSGTVTGLGAYDLCMWSN